MILCRHNLLSRFVSDFKERERHRPHQAQLASPVEPARPANLSARFGF